MTKKLKVVAKPYEYECGDGCCYEYGYDVYITDEKGVKEFPSTPTVEDALLEYFYGQVDIEVEYLND